MNVLARSFPRVAAAVMGCTAALILVGALDETDRRISRHFDHVTRLDGRHFERTEHLFTRIERLERHTGLHDQEHAAAPAQACAEVQDAELVDEGAGQ